MRSFFRIEYDFDCKEPFIRIIVEQDSDDMRDRMLSHFFEMVGENSTLGLVYEESPNLVEEKTKSIIKLFPLDTKTARDTYPKKGK